MSKPRTGMAAWLRGIVVSVLAVIGVLLWIAAALAGSALSPLLGVAAIVGLFIVAAAVANTRTRAGRGGAF